MWQVEVTLSHQAGSQPRIQTGTVRARAKGKREGRGMERRDRERESNEREWWGRELARIDLRSGCMQLQDSQCQNLRPGRFTLCGSKERDWVPSESRLWGSRENTVRAAHLRVEVTAA